MYEFGNRLVLQAVNNLAAHCSVLCTCLMYVMFKFEMTILSNTAIAGEKCTKIMVRASFMFKRKNDTAYNMNLICISLESSGGTREGHMRLITETDGGTCIMIIFESTHIRVFVIFV